MKANITDVLVIGSTLSGFDLLLGLDVLRFFDVRFQKCGSFSLIWP